MIGGLLNAIGLGSKALGGVGEFAETLEDVFTTSDREKLSAYAEETRRLEVEQTTQLGQIRTNQAEARHRSIFVAGWRPFIGWSCGIMFVLHLGVFPTVEIGLSIWAPAVALPQFNIELIAGILAGMLGLNKTLRTVEKAKGVARHR